MITITGPGPVWASSSPSKKNQAWKPKASEFAAFATAVAKRYGAVTDRYLIYNEPNQKGWLQPQFSCKKSHGHRVCTAGLAAHLPRARARRRPGRPQGGPGLGGRDRRAGAGRQQADQRQHADGAADVPARVRLRGQPLQVDPHGRLQGLQGGVGRQLRLPPAPEEARARPAQPGHQRRPVRRPEPAVHGARQAHAPQADQGEGRPVQDPPDGVRLRDQPAGQGQRRLAVRPDALHPAGGVHRLEDEADRQPRLLPVGGRARPQPGQGRATATATTRPASRP